MEERHILKAILVAALAALFGCQAATSRPVAAPRATQTAVPATAYQPQASNTAVAQCSPVLDSSPQGWRGQGVLMLTGYGLHDRLNLMDLSDSAVTETDVSRFTLEWYGVAVSPDRRSWAYYGGSPETDTSQLIIGDAEGKARKAFPWDDDWLSIDGWINADAIGIQARAPSYGDWYETILNVSTGQRQEVNSRELPDFEQSTWTWMHPDPSLGAILYPDYSELIMFDRQSKAVVAHVPSFIDTYRADAAWSPDGRYVALVAPKPELERHGLQDDGMELYILNRSGTVAYLTELPSLYGESLFLSVPRWSPDGTRIAFLKLGSSELSRRASLAVLDIRTGDTTDFCVTTDSYIPSRGAFTPAPIWSPDGKQIAFESRTGEDNGYTVVLDLTRHTAFKLAKGTPVGWMLNEP